MSLLGRKLRALVQLVDDVRLKVSSLPVDGIVPALDQLDALKTVLLQLADDADQTYPRATLWRRVLEAIRGRS